MKKVGLLAVTFLAAALPGPSHSYPQHSTWDWGGRRLAHCRSALPGALEERIAFTSPLNPTADYQRQPGLIIIDPTGSV